MGIWQLDRCLETKTNLNKFEQAKFLQENTIADSPYLDFLEDEPFLNTCQAKCSLKTAQNTNDRRFKNSCSFSVRIQYGGTFRPYVCVQSISLAIACVGTGTSLTLTFQCNLDYRYTQQTVDPVSHNKYLYYCTLDLYILQIIMKIKYVRINSILQ